ncbi:MAG: HNH endonuclease family protein [Actinotignum sanguinis]|uniref:HNH endonuclease family protein n=1 Tax=Actinotignum sanguinis TaxID=1445614 RepID=UPI00237D9113|nr:HNH endonuclease family protein [Actinotignum sanguinis]MDE1553680.1 HNH endonuclease family protein [Actinotignum sanguinis]MDE1642589.1 HNH endonuclease family protein [Actinotignum sanguinis]MDK8287418.1 HNH endonuclease family protein [Actinotignum sanguinis]MDK8651844.1 HNH endonuclease family protein [Actinotignum sanguinis]MDK8802301.1 HNH endonuclease family protein [Actinotignum sanguinis]
MRFSMGRSGARHGDTQASGTSSPHRRMWTVIAALLMVLAAALLQLSHTGSDSEPGGIGSASSGTLTASQALSALSELPGGRPDSGRGYSRAEFGLEDGWPDTDGDGCTVRNEVLRRDLAGVTFWSGKSTPPGCVVATGTLRDPYTGTEISFDRAREPQAVTIDHVVALYDAWRAGAQDWDADTRAQFATDPLNLLAVSGAANKEKGHATAARWLPDNPAFVCEYAARQVAVKRAYGLRVDDDERHALHEVLSDCVR